jgi:hypothetical protein
MKNSNKLNMQFPRRQLEIVFQCLEENKKKPEGCF